MKQRVKYWAILFNPLFVALYFVGMRWLYELCMYGGIRRRLPVIAVCGFLGFLWVVAWTIIWFFGKRQREQKASGKRAVFVVLLCAELLAVAAISGYYGVRIVQSAQKYTGKLSWKLDEWRNSREIVLEHDNLLEDGIDGIFTDLQEKLDLPEELYISNYFSVVFDGDGKIQQIYSLMYGRNEKGESHTYLLDYERSKGENMTVWIDDGGGDYSEEEELEPLRELFDAEKITSVVEKWQEDYGVETFRIRYQAHELSLFVPEREDLFTVSYDDGWVKPEEPEPEVSYEIGVSVKEQSDGSVYFFLNEKTGWRLTVIDAALGSRWYGLEFTEDGGDTWENLNEDPFNGSMGVAEEIHFFDEAFGFLLLGGASESHAELYVTRDGGKTLQEVKLPKEQVTDNIPNLEEYDYTTMPVKEGETLKTELRLEKQDCSRLLFESYDNGETWNYTGFLEE